MKDWTDDELQDIAQKIYWSVEAQPGDPVKILRDLLSEAKEEERKELSEKIKEAVAFGVLPIPNPYGEWVGIQKHNDLMKNVLKVLDHPDEFKKEVK